MKEQWTVYNEPRGMFNRLTIMQGDTCIAEMSHRMLKGEAEQNAALIVKAVNSHEALVALAKRIAIMEYADEHPYTAGLKKEAQAALKLAE